MEKNTKLFLIALSAILLIGIGTYFYQKISIKSKGQNQQPAASQPKSDVNTDALAGNEEAFKNALNLYADKKEAGADLSNGPCLGVVSPGWYLDIAHNPRIEVDDKTENQCVNSKDGKVPHIIELDTEGKLIKVLY